MDIRVIILQNSYFEVLIKLYIFCLRWDTSTDAKDLQLRSLKSLKRQRPLVCIKTATVNLAVVVILNTGMEKDQGKEIISAATRMISPGKS